MARAIFKSWFVDFGPVRAKAEGRQLFGIDAATSALFPDSFEDSRFGRIPKGWGVGVLRDSCERIENGGTPKRSEASFWHPATIQWLTSGEVRRSIVVSTAQSISQEGYQASNARLWPKGTTVVALYGATAGQVCLLAEKMCANQACCGLISRADTKYFNFLWVSSSADELRRSARGSAQQNISQGIVASLPILIPDASTRRCFDELMQPIFDKAILNVSECDLLAKIRDTLLPKLISGEIRVKDAQQMAEAKL